MLDEENLDVLTAIIRSRGATCVNYGVTKSLKCLRENCVLFVACKAQDRQNTYAMRLQIAIDIAGPELTMELLL